MLYEESKTFLGTGWSFPPVFDEEKGGIVMVSEEDDISQSLRLLLSTIPGERLMNPKYGCDLQSKTFQTINEGTISEIKELIGQAILYFEPRIDLEEISIEVVDQDDGRLDIKVVYTIRKVNVRSNIVFPFYFIEGTDIQQIA